MMNLDLTPSESVAMRGALERGERTVAWVERGKRVSCDTCDGDGWWLDFDEGVTVTCPDCLGARTIPERLAAVADKKCETCGGLGCTCIKFCERSHDHACPDCIDGSAVIQLRAECDTCEGTPRRRHEYDPDEWEDCPHCNSLGWVPLARATVQVSEVYANSLGGWQITLPSIARHVPPLDPPPVPGEWVVLVILVGE